MKVKELKKLIKNHKDNDEVLLFLDIVTAYQIEKYAIKPAVTDFYRIDVSTIKPDKEKESESLILSIKNNLIM